MLQHALGERALLGGLESHLGEGIEVGAAAEVWPPSTAMTWPVIHDDSGPMRKRTTLAMSLGRAEAAQRHLVEVVGVDRRVVHEATRGRVGSGPGARRSRARRAAELVGGVADASRCRPCETQ